MNKQSGLIGGITSRLLGSQFSGGEGKIIAANIGGFAGSLIGGQIDKTIDEYDRQMMEKSSRQALEFSPSGNSVEWKNPVGRNSGSITPTKTFKESGRYCREYVQEVMIGGEEQKTDGKACHQPDGNWKIIK